MTLAQLMVGTLLFGLIAADVVRNGPLARLDLTVDAALRIDPKSRTSAALRLISLMGSELAFAAGLPLAFVLAWRRCWRPLAALLLGVGGGEAANLALKLLFARQRLDAAEIAAGLDSYTFPSGHAMVAWIFYGLTTSWLLNRLGLSPQRASASAGARLLVLLIGFSQIVIGGHYLSDVLAGYAAGMAWLALTIASVETVGVR